MSATNTYNFLGQCTIQNCTAGVYVGEDAGVGQEKDLSQRLCQREPSLLYQPAAISSHLTFPLKRPHKHK